MTWQLFLYAFCHHFAVVSGSYNVTVLFTIAEIREVKYGERSGIYWLGSYPFPLAKRDVSLITVEHWLCLSRNAAVLENLCIILKCVCLKKHMSCAVNTWRITCMHFLLNFLFACWLWVTRSGGNATADSVLKCLTDCAVDCLV